MVMVPNFLNFLQMVGFLIVDALKKTTDIRMLAGSKHEGDRV